MKIRLVPKIKPGSKASLLLHALFNVAVIFVILGITVEPISLPVVAVIFFMFSKWRMYAVKPRHWLANTRANMVDIMVGISYIIFVFNTSSITTRMVLTLLYVGWVLFIKPGSSSLMVGVQAMVAQLVAMIALYNEFSSLGVMALVLLTWTISYSVARHFFSSFEEPNGRTLSHIWGLFGAQLAWILSHWTLNYGPVPQIALLLTVIGYIFAVSYYVKSTRGLSASQKNQFIIFTAVIVIIVALFSEWQYNG